MILTTTDEVPGHRITSVLGLVRGNTVRARHVGRDILAAFRGMVGGEVDEYTKVLAESREQALDRMRAQAVEMGAEAVVDIHFSSSMVMSGAAEMLAYGTAVTLEEV
ncbi:MAG: YbjQ family protein [Planctomycetes bacterium]|nr:YbjQ family protein [Planctomycetota bacterium]